jgi:hypothetical protein
MNVPGAKEPVPPSPGGNDLHLIAGMDCLGQHLSLSRQMYLPVDLLLVNLAVRAAATNPGRAECSNPVSLNDINKCSRYLTMHCSEIKLLRAFSLQCKKNPLPANIRDRNNISKHAGVDLSINLTI